MSMSYVANTDQHTADRWETGLGDRLIAPEELPAPSNFCKLPNMRKYRTFHMTFPAQNPLKVSDMDYSQDIIMISSGNRHWAGNCRRLGEKGQKSASAPGMKNPA